MNRDAEREQVEWVFGCTGGELSDRPWSPEGEGNPVVCQYWHEGVPDWTEWDFRDQYDTGITYRTVMRDCLFGYPPEVLVDDDGAIWTRVADYRTSGETECPGRQDDDCEGLVEAGHCAPDTTVCTLCEADLGEEHGYIYLGDGWYTLVYRRDEIYEGLARLRKEFMVPEVWEADYWVVETSEGTEIVPCALVPVPDDVDVGPETFKEWTTGEFQSAEVGFGWLAHLSAPGYMDQTDLTAHRTQREAEEYLVETYGQE